MRGLVKNIGFTLVEMLLVTAIMAIVAAIAYPSYIGAVKKSRRVDAMENLEGFSLALSRYHAQYATYVGADGASLFPAKSPISGNTKYYDLTAVDLTATGFRVQATPIAGTSQSDDGVIELLSTNQRRWDEGGDGFSAEDNDWEAN